MPTLSGLRRRGIPASALRTFVTSVGVTKFDSVTEVAVFENAVRTELNATAQRRLAVLRPIKLILTNIPAGEVITCNATNNPQDENPTTREIPLTREVFIESDDFAEVPPPKFFRLKPGGEVRLKYACIIKCDELVKDASGTIAEIRCTAQLDTRHGQPNADKKVKGTIHWVSATKCVNAEVRLYDRLFTVPEPAAEDDFLKVVNPKSLEIVTAKLEPSLITAMSGLERFQFERLGYFCLDSKDSQLSTLAPQNRDEWRASSADASRAASTPQRDSSQPKLIFNRTITLRDTWAK